jgi:hypothetical protein
MLDSPKEIDFARLNFLVKEKIIKELPNCEIMTTVFYGAIGYLYSLLTVTSKIEKVINLPSVGIDEKHMLQILINELKQTT